MGLRGLWIKTYDGFAVAIFEKHFLFSFRLGFRVPEPQQTLPELVLKLLGVDSTYPISCGFELSTRAAGECFFEV